MRISKKGLVVLAIVALAAIFPFSASAQLSAFKTILFAPVLSTLFALTWFIATILGGVITVVAWLLQVVIYLNTQVINSAPVQFGFPVVLGFANLLFVFAMLVISVATILRIESYGVKRSLWRLVLIAIAVNFGLVVSSALLAMSDNISLYLLQSVDPGDSVGNASTGFSSINNFSSALAGAFNPQKLWITSKGESASGGFVNTLSGFLSGDLLGAMIAPFIALVFTVLGSLAIIIVLAGLVVMFLHRYVTLSFLLIFLPLAWASFVFERSASNFRKWWSRLWSQLIFGPAALFMLWLAIQTSYVMSQNSLGSNFSQFQSSNSLWQGISQIFTGAFASIIGPFLELIVMVSIIVGGLTAAKKAGMEGGEFAMKLVESAKKQGTDFIKKRSSTFATNRGEALGRRIGNRLPVGNKLTQYLDKRDLGKIPDLRKKFEEKGLTQVLAELKDPNFKFKTDAERMAAVDYLRKEKALDKVERIDLFNNFAGDQTEAVYNKFKRGNYLKEINTATNFDIRKALEGNEEDSIRTIAKNIDGQKRIAEYLNKIKDKKSINPDQMRLLMRSTMKEIKGKQVDKFFDAMDNDTANAWKEAAKNEDFVSSNDNLKRWLERNPNGVAGDYDEYLNYKRPAKEAAPKKEEPKIVIAPPERTREENAERMAKLREAAGDALGNKDKSGSSV